MIKATRHAYRLVGIAILAVAIFYLETERPFSSFRLFSFVLLFLQLANATWLSSGRWRERALVASSLVFGLCLIEAAADVVAPLPSLTTTPGFAGRHALLGWGPTAAGRFHSVKRDPWTGHVIYDATYTIDDDLLRKIKSCAGCATLAFFGDSFTFGEGLDDADTLPQSLADALGRKVHVLDFGFPGYGPQQFLRALETGHFDKVIGPAPKLFIFLTAPWHAERSSCRPAWVQWGPRYALEKGGLAYKGACSQGALLRLREWLGHTASYQAFIDPLFERLGHADIELYLRIVCDAVRIAKEKYGAPTLIPFMQAKDAALAATGFTNADIIKRLQANGAYVVDVTLPERTANGDALSIAGDGHPTALANRLRAAMLKEYILRQFGAEIAPQVRQLSRAVPK